MMHFRTIALLGIILALFPLQAMAAELRLLMIEQRGCAYCKLWDQQVAESYGNSVEGARAPLQRLDLRAPLPEGVELVSRPVFTPTFILLRDGKESGRIEGYMAAHFFWEHLTLLLERASVP